MTTQTSDAALAAQALAQIAEVKGQLTVIAQMIAANHEATNQRIVSNHEATNQRIEDFRNAVETRFSGVEERLTVLEKNERGTALRTAGGGALAGALVSAAIALMNKAP